MGIFDGAAGGLADTLETFQGAAEGFAEETILELEG